MALEAPETSETPAAQPASTNTLPTDPNLQPQAEAFRQDVAAKFGLTNIGGYREGDPQDHGKGLAVDVMVPVGSEVGNQVAQYAVDNIANAGISYVIYRQQFYAPVNNIYGPANTWNKMPDRGSVTENHYLQEYSVEITLNHPDDVLSLFGTNERHLKLIEENLNVIIHARTERVQILGDDEESVELARLTIQALLVLVERGMLVNTSDVVTALTMAQDGSIDKFVALYEEEIIKDNSGKPIRVKTLGQKVYVDSIKSHDVVFGIGPAGTGKTFLAVTLAVTALKRGQVKRIVLTRPAVEAGESLGFLPGDLKEKVDPYLRPVYDALYQILGKEQTTRLMEREIIEIAPLAYMRGRTLEDAFVILDEAQNTTIMQMKMFLTRLGFNSKMIVNGDMSQIDLPRRVKSGLVDAMEKLKGIKAIDFVHFSASDVVRHPVVADIINAYEKDAPKFDLEKKSEESDQAKEVVSGLTEYPVIGAEDLKK